MKREHWGGRFAFVMAAAGSAVGLGNIWKFPYIVGLHGGAAFVLVYLVCIALIGMPLMLAELIIGRATQKSPIAAFKALAPRSMWWLVGAMGVMAGYLILSFYSVVAGWTLEYLGRSLLGDYTGLGKTTALMELKQEYASETAKKQLEALLKKSSEESGGLPVQTQELDGLPELQARLASQAKEEDLRTYAIGKSFGQHTASGTRPLFWHLVFMSLTMFVVVAGVGGGIERASKILMPVLFLILVGLMIRGLTLPGSWGGVLFLVSPDFTKLTPEAVLEALGHAFFTLSLGMGAMLTYGSYLSKDANLYKSGLLVVLADTMIALVAGFAIYPAVFAYGLDPGSGAGLIFVTMPVVFSRMTAGYALGALFFTALFVAALTSAISLLEVCVAHFIDEWGWSRVKATTLAGGSIALLGIPSALDWNFLPLGGLGGMTFFDVLDKLTTNYFLPFGGLFTVLFVGWYWKKEDLLVELEKGDEGLGSRYAGPWIFLCRYIAPVMILVVALYKLELIKFH
jgi:NSS family neurotransmitter:Na+ symporter